MALGGQGDDEGWPFRGYGRGIGKWMDGCLEMGPRGPVGGAEEILEREGSA